MASLRSRIGRAVQISSDDEAPRSSKPKTTEFAAHGSLEAHDFGAVVDAGDSRQAGCHGLHRQEELGVEGQRPGMKGAQLQGQEDVGQEPQQDSHHSGHRQAIAALHFAEDLACGSHEMQSSSRVHAMQSQSTQQMVGLPGMWKPLANG